MVVGKNFKKHQTRISLFNQSDIETQRAAFPFHLGKAKLAEVVKSRVIICVNSARCDGLPFYHSMDKIYESQLKLALDTKV